MNTTSKSYLQHFIFMKAGTEDSFNTRRMSRSYYRSFRNQSLSKSKNTGATTGLCIQEIHTKDEKIFTEEEEHTGQAISMSITQSPVTFKRFPSARTNRDSSPSPTKFHSPVRIKSTLMHNFTPKKPRLSIDSDCFNTKLFKLAEMFSTATTLVSESKIPVVSAQSYCVMSLNNRKVILGENADVKRQVASLTKLMTALTVFNICKRYGVDLSSTLVQIDQDASSMEGTTANLKYGDEMSVMDLLHGMLLPSGNDAAIALASHFGKFLSCMYSSEESNRLASRFQHYKEYYDLYYKDDSVKLFMFEMNRIAGEIGLKNTHFHNPTGLQHENSYSTAYDMAWLSVAFANNQTLRNITQKKTYHHDVYNQRLCTRKSGIWRNTNHLLWRRRDCKGLKTGFTPWAGPCLSSVFNVKHTEIIIVVLKCASPEDRFMDTEKLYFWFKDSYLN